MNKLLIVFALIFLQVVCGKVTEDDLPHLHKECLKELNLPAEVLLSNYHEDFTVTEGVPDFNRIIYCACKKGDFLNADDTLDNVKFHQFLVHELMKMANINVDNAEAAATNAIDACIAVQGTDPGDTLVKNYNCILNFLQKL